MANALPPIPIKSPMVDKNGAITFVWSAYHRELFERVGGVSGASNSQILGLISSLQDRVSDLEGGLNKGPTL